MISSLSFATACYLAGLPADHKPEPEEILLAFVQVYDQRGGGVETAFREDKQGLDITKRNKKSFAAQALVTNLTRWHIISSFGSERGWLNIATSFGTWVLCA